MQYKGDDLDLRVPDLRVPDLRMPDLRMADPRGADRNQGGRSPRDPFAPDFDATLANGIAVNTRHTSPRCW